jgi:cytochrome P450
MRFASNPLTFLQNLVERHGDVVQMKMLRRHWTFLSHPTDIEDFLVGHASDVVRDDYARLLRRILGYGLLTSDGDLWKRQRKLVAAAFTPKRIRDYADSMTRVTDQGLSRFADGKQIDVHAEMSHLTLDVVADVLFGANVSDSDVDVVRRSVEVFMTLFASSPELVLGIPEWVPTALNRATKKSLTEMDAIIHRIIATRRASGERRNDVLDAMMDAMDEDGSRMDDAQLRDEVFTLFGAGHETTALALTHALYAIGTHPDVKRKLWAEIESVLGGRLPTQADVSKLVYTDRVIKEAMRLYPPVWMTGREVAKEMTVGGVRLVPGTQVAVSQWIVNHDPRWWPNPQAFDPDRFEPELTKSRPRFAYFPFGGGPRICVGNHFAMMEAVLMLAIIAQRWDVQILPFERLEFAPSITLRAKDGKGLRAKLVQRAGAAKVADVRSIGAA